LSFNTLSTLCSPLSACAQEEKGVLKAEHHWTWKVRNLRRPHVLLRHKGLVDFNNGALVLPEKTRKQIFLEVAIATDAMDGDAGRLSDAVFTILHHRTQASDHAKKFLLATFCNEEKNASTEAFLLSNGELH
jgi:hypothetical protein